MRIDIHKNKLSVYTEKEIYNEDVLHKCFYWYATNFNVTVSNFSPHLFLIEVEINDQKEDLTELVNKVKRDLIDFKLRDIVTKETKSIRELLIAKAFAYYEYDENPITEVSDPVGFNPENI